MDVAQVRQVGHTGRNAAQQPHQLDDGKLAIVSLREGRKEKTKKDQQGGGRGRKFYQQIKKTKNKNVMVLQQKR